MNIQKFSTKIHNLIPEKNGNHDNLHNLDQFGYVNIINVTIDKSIAEIGEEVTVSTVYSLICNEGYEIAYGNLGINKLGWFEFKECLIEGVLYHNVTEVIGIDPSHFDAFDNCTGKAIIKIVNIADDEEYKIYSNSSNKILELRKAALNYTLIEQYPLTIFSQDIANFSILIYNEHNIRYAFPNEYIGINVTNQENSLNFSKWTDIRGFLNFSLDCSMLGSGNYTIRLTNDETQDYEAGTTSFQLEVFNETSCINYSLLNEDEVYVTVDLEKSNFSKAFFIIQCVFNANISWSSTFGSGQFIKATNHYEGIISSPNKTGIYQINFTAQPLTTGKKIEFARALHVKRRPTELISSFSRDKNQSILNIQISIIDKLNNQFIESSSSLNITIQYNNSIQELELIEINSNNSISFPWKIPNSIIEDFITFTLRFNQSQVYQSSISNKSLVITNLEYFGPLSGYISNNLTIKARFFALNGSLLSNQILYLRINNQNFSLKTNFIGEISYLIKAPSFSTKIEVEIRFLGSIDILSSFLTFEIEIKLNLIHKIWNSLGYILLGVSGAIILIIYLKRLIIKRNLVNLNVD